ncbi:MAG TPA: hypothetical protein VLX64_04035 [Thermoplasmata archaeon]|nr:hypothetical protein [Thermoplasmata archaeon]
MAHPFRLGVFLTLSLLSLSSGLAVSAAISTNASGALGASGEILPGASTPAPPDRRPRPYRKVDGVVGWSGRLIVGTYPESVTLRFVRI